MGWMVEPVTERIGVAESAEPWVKQLRRDKHSNLLLQISCAVTQGHVGEHM